MITPTERPWNSATTLYIARKIQQFAATRSEPLKVLDMGCGAANMTELLHGYGYDQYGYDISLNLGVVYPVVSRLYPDDYKTRFVQAPDERTIPFADDQFDVIYANQVFEHVRFIDQMFAECARVLRPGGMLIALFPLASGPIEFHVRVPFVHWMPPGPLRVHYLRAFFALGLRAKEAGKSAHEMAVHWENYLRQYTYYRYLNEVAMLAEHYFERWEMDTAGYIQARRDLSALSRRSSHRALKMILDYTPEPLLNYLISHYFGATLVMRSPRQG
jgi:SAM-dependent methyltransferase